MKQTAAAPVSLRRLVLTGRHLVGLMVLLLLVPACGGEPPEPDAPGTAPTAPTAPAAPDAAVELTAGVDPVDLIEEVVEGAEDPASQAPPVASTPLPAGLPVLDAATRKAATETLQPVRKLLADLLARYATAMEANRKGDDAGRRTALGEARTLGYEVQDRWNEVIATMPANDAFDEEETASHYFPAELAMVVDALDALKNIERQLRR